MDGIVNILKPSGMTSHDVVSFVRRCTRIKKVGHTGTLDPQAIGVLPVCIGKATKVVDLITEREKTYRAELKLGVTTDTQDSYGKILDQHKVNFSGEIIREVMMDFEGTIEQIPPMYSAVKVKGQKLYELARKGIEVKRQPRKVKISYIDIIDVDLQEHTVLFDVECSKGTYIRTLCHDIGQRLGCGAHMSFLLRTKSGPFSLKQAVTVEDFQRRSIQGDIRELLIPIDKMFLHFPSVTVNAVGEKKVMHGTPVEDRFLYGNDVLMADTTYRIYNKEGKFLCLSRTIENTDGTYSLKMEKSFY